ncbi:MAG TPA: lytic transglycosylase domain-containing protein [Thermoanaerobaculia bacterium]|nr:lytic transglycosylase domain-containing protein [Thermoanaerobaculia bacterium]
MTRSHRLLPVALFLAFAAGLAPAIPANAELVVLTDGRFLKVKSYEVAGEQARLDLPYGGRMTLPIERVERIVDDEYIPPPEPAPLAAISEVVAEAAPAGPIPLRFAESQPVPEGPYGTLIYETAKRHQVNPQVVAALIRQESAGKVRAVSHKGARGLMQLMPATAQRFGVRKEQLFEPQHNLEAGVRYLSWLMDQFPNDLAKILAAYNAGEGAVARYKGIPPYRETQNYVRRIFTNLGLAITDL